MGYSIHIGQRGPCDENGLPSVEDAEHDDAPIGGNGDISGKTNGRYPSYSAFSEWCRETGLTSMFFDDTFGLMRDHPGAVDIQREHLMGLNVALDRYRAAHPDATAASDYNLFRMEWFRFWFAWALENCSAPIIANH